MTRWGIGRHRRSRFVPRRAIVAGLIGVSLLSLASCGADAAPQMGTAVGANGKAMVTWEPPVGDNALTLTSYVITPYIGSVAQASVSLSPTARTATVTGLTNGATYTFTVHGINALGNATSRSARSNAVTPAVGVAVSVASGGHHTCALLTTGAVECWGSNAYGQLGDGTTTSSATPVTVVGITDAVTVSAGEDHTCAVVTSGDVLCWGYNSNGQAGNMATTVSQRLPVPVYGVVGATAVSAGHSHTCAVEASGRVLCWGYQGYGQLGNGVRIARGDQNPNLVAGLAPAVAVAANGNSSCAALIGGEARCWGSGGSGQLGDGTYATFSLTPVAVIGLADATSISAGYSHACARVVGGTVKCWGANNSGALGNGVSDGSGSSSTAALVPGLTGVTAGGAGGTGACVRLTSGSARCWGWNYYGQLGNGTTTTSAVPVAVSGVSTAVGVSSSHLHACAVMANGTVSCWGMNYYGQLGNSALSQSSTPVPVIGL